MGRHATAGEAGASAPGRHGLWWERAALAVVAAATIAGVLRWAGLTWLSAILAAGAVAVVVVLAALVAATVPPPHPHAHALEHHRSAAGPLPSSPPRREPPAPDPRSWPGGP
ncbi:MAG TPA: hypothetical protein VMV41_17025 [Cellulomonadaceae bacterium]|nr:hypothetical protein [Cellulomonadaceae bacterium]